MKNAIFASLLMLASFGVHGQSQKKKPVKQIEHPATAMLSAEQKIHVKQIHQQFVVDMKAAIDAPAANPIEKRLRIEKLRAARDSSLKVRLGEQVYESYRQKTIVKKR